MFSGLRDEHCGNHTLKRKKIRSRSRNVSAPASAMPVAQACFQPVAEQRHGFAQLLIGVVHGRGSRRWGASARGNATRCRDRRRFGPHVVLARPKPIRRPESVGAEPQRFGQCAELRGGEDAQGTQRDIGPEPRTHRAHLGDAPGELFGEEPDDDRQDVMDETDPALDPAHRPRELDRIAAQIIWPRRPDSGHARRGPPPLRGCRVHRAAVRPDSPAVGWWYCGVGGSTSERCVSRAGSCARRCPAWPHSALSRPHPHRFCNDELSER